MSLWARDLRRPEPDCSVRITFCVMYDRSTLSSYPESRSMAAAVMSSPFVRVLALAVIVMLAGCAAAPNQPTPEQRAQAVIANPIRTDQDRQMDASRSPAECLPFTGVRPGMVVLRHPGRRRRRPRRGIS